MLLRVYRILSSKLFCTQLLRLHLPSLFYRHSLPAFVESPHQLIKYYGQLLGHPIEFVRNFSAKSFSIIIKALKPTKLASHLKKIVKAVSHVLDEFCVRTACDPAALPEISSFPDQENKLSDSRMVDLLEGVGLLMFQSCRGVKGCLHSKAAGKLESLLHIALPPFEPSPSTDRSQDTLAEKLAGFSVSTAYTSSFVLTNCVRSLLHHVEHSQIEPLWQFLTTALEGLVPYAGSYAKHSSQTTSASASFRFACNAILGTALYALSKVDRRKLPSASSASCRRIVTAIVSIGKAFFSLDSHRDIIPLLATHSRLFCQLWAIYPSDPGLLEASTALLPLMLSRTEPEPVVAQVTTQLLETLPVAIAQTHLFPAVFAALSDLSERSDAVLWLPEVLQSMAFFDTRSRVQDLQLALPSSQTTALDEYLGVSNEYLLRLYDSVEKCLRAQLESEDTVTLQLACHTLAWLSKMVAPHLTIRKKTSALKEALMAELLQGVGARGPAVISAMVHLQ